MSPLTPAQIVAELDRYIVGQDDAKRVVAIALRDRWRRLQLPDDLRDEVQPRNILMIGPTGVGKTEIARRVSRIINAPFLKVEATTFTEVGYVGRDVESIVRDLVEIAVSMIHTERLEAVRRQAADNAMQRLVDLLVQQSESKATEKRRAPHTSEGSSPDDQLTPATKRALTRKRKRYAELLQREAIENENVEIVVDAHLDPYRPRVEIVSMDSSVDMHDSMHEFLDAISQRSEPRSVTVSDARRILTQQEADRLVDLDSVVATALQRVEQSGVVFIDELDKTIHSNMEYGPDVSGQGVQRDLLPIIEGAIVMTRHGPVKTDNILFIAAGSFSSSRPSDLIPELQGRLPLRVELSSLDEDDLYAILTEPANALTRQYTALLATEGVSLSFAEDGLREIARLAAEVNARTEDIGARRLVTVIERVLESVSFEASDRAGGTQLIDAEYVSARIGDIAADEDLSSAIL